MELWYPGAVRVPGPIEKTGYAFPGETGPKRGETKHSADGYWGGIYSVLFDLERRASWHFTIGYDRVEQHFAIDVHCWHAGDTDDDDGVAANFDLVGVEHLGRGRPQRLWTPLTAWQENETIKLSSWLGAQFGRTEFVRFPTLDLATDVPGMWLETEHNEVSNSFTWCPSNRINWPAIMAELNKGNATPEDDMTEYRLANAWGPPQTWIVAVYVDPDSGYEFPLYKRWIMFQESAAALTVALGEPKTFSHEAMAYIPTID